MKKNIEKLLLLAALLFNQTIFAQTQIGLDILGETPGDESGHSISMPDLHTIAIGTPLNSGAGVYAGHVRVFKWDGVAWVQKGMDIDGEAANDFSGRAVSMPDSNTVAIGAGNNDGDGIGAYTGHIRVYSWTGTAWVQKGTDINGVAANDQLGALSVCMPDANTVIAGAPGNNAGHVSIYTWSGTAWVQKGLDINGEAPGDQFGWSVSMPDANHVVVGAPYNDSIGIDAGYACIYKWTGTSWVQMGLVLYGEIAGDFLGCSVSMPDSNTVAVGASNNAAGYTRIYQWSGSAWVQKGSDILGEAAGDRSGAFVSMPDASTVAIGAPNSSGGIFVYNGQTRIYGWTGSDWNQLVGDMEGLNSYDESGFSVSMPSGGVVALAARGNDGAGSGTNVGQVRIFSLPIIGVEEYSMADLSVYPNPSSNRFNIEWSEESDPINYTVSAMDGKTVLTGISNSGDLVLDLTNYSKGVYAFTAKSGHTVFNAKLVLK